MHASVRQRIYLSLTLYWHLLLISNSGHGGLNYFSLSVVAPGGGVNGSFFCGELFLLDGGICECHCANDWGVPRGSPPGMATVKLLHNSIIKLPNSKLFLQLWSRPIRFEIKPSYSIREKQETAVHTTVPNRKCNFIYLSSKWRCLLSQGYKYICVCNYCTLLLFNTK